MNFGKKYKEKIEIELEKIKEADNKIFELKREIKNLQRKMNVSENSTKRKERARRLIELGVLFEISGLQNIDKSALLGYLLNFHSLKSEEIDEIRVVGAKKFEERLIVKK